MSVGLVIAIFLIVAAILMALFCILTKLFSYKLKIQRRQVQLMFPLQQAYHISSQDISGAYEQFRQKQENLKNMQSGSKQIEKDLNIKVIQPTKISQIFDISNDIYGLRSLRRRLDSDTIPLVSQIDGSMSLKQFNITKIATQRVQQHYKYVKKLISYAVQSLRITEIKATYIKKINNDYQLVKMVQDYVIDDESNNLLDALELHGFYYGDFGYYKYTHSIDTTNMKQNQTRPLKMLQTNISKQLISLQQYNRQREIMLLSI